MFLKSSKRRKKQGKIMICYYKRCHILYHDNKTNSTRTFLDHDSIYLLYFGNTNKLPY